MTPEQVVEAMELELPLAATTVSSYWCSLRLSPTSRKRLDMFELLCEFDQGSKAIYCSLDVDYLNAVTYVLNEKVQKVRACAAALTR